LFRKYSSVKSQEIRPVGAVLLHADRWTVGQTWRA